MFTNKVDLCGYMHFWGLTVDVISAVDIIIAIGLCVDYAGAFFFTNICSLLKLTKTFPPQCTYATPS